MKKRAKGMKKVRKSAPQKWLTTWCRDHLDELLNNRGRTVTVHPKHGIVAVANDLTEVGTRREFLKRSIMADSCHVDVDWMLKVLKVEPEGPIVSISEPDPHSNLPDLSPIAPDEGIPAKSHRMTLEAYAKLRNQKATTVLLKLLEWGHKDIHIRSELDEATVDQLDLHYGMAKALEVIVSGSNPFPSRHKQPPFTPASFDPSDAVIDGGGASYRRSWSSRGPTFD